MSKSCTGLTWVGCKVTAFDWLFVWINSHQRSRLMCFGLSKKMDGGISVCLSDQCPVLWHWLWTWHTHWPKIVQTKLHNLTAKQTIYQRFHACVIQRSHILEGIPSWFFGHLTHWRVRYDDISCPGPRDL